MDLLSEKWPQVRLNSIISRTHTHRPSLTDFCCFYFRLTMIPSKILAIWRDKIAEQSDNRGASRRPTSADNCTFAVWEYLQQIFGQSSVNSIWEDRQVGNVSWISSEFGFSVGFPDDRRFRLSQIRSDGFPIHGGVDGRGIGAGLKRFGFGHHIVGEFLDGDLFELSLHSTSRNTSRNQHFAATFHCCHVHDELKWPQLRCLCCTDDFNRIDHSPNPQR